MVIQSIRWAAVAYAGIAARTLATGLVTAVAGIVAGNQPLAHLGAGITVAAVLLMVATIPLTTLPRR
jgi:hypothetical protein